MMDMPLLNSTRSFSPPTASSAPPALCPTTNGVMVVDKPEGLTSFDVVAMVKRTLGFRKVGHCGTLDPFATGVLVVCVNQATRIVDQLLTQDKIYRFSLRLGVETDTLDKTGQVVRISGGPSCSEEELRSVVAGFMGSQLQQVPRYAAVKVGGRRLYALSRKGIDVELPRRQVYIQRLELVAYRWPEAHLEVECSKGTYVRQLAEDIGRTLGCGAHVSSLRRLASGSFGVDQAVALAALKGTLREDFRPIKLISMSEALAHLPAISVDDQAVLRRLQDGTLDPTWEAGHRHSFPERNGPVRIVAGSDQLIALWWPHPEPEQQRRLRVFQS